MESMPYILGFDQWTHKHKDMMLISGPCSAESETQLRATTKALVATDKVDVLRAGVWKPRTRPHAFEGHGEKALQWLYNIKKDMQIPIAVEVAQPEHIDLALKYDIDILWIGARTTVNPFSVQALADALQGVKTTVLVKNPTHPEIGLWIGALERFYAAGIKRLMAVHRGFHSYHPSTYRNMPLWEIPIELKRRFPKLPLLVDPSHICGKRDTIATVSQQAMDLGMDGLMIESHYQPHNALTDAQQQLTPEDLNSLITSLKIRRQYINNLDTDYLSQMRLQIDKLDNELIRLLAQRLEIVEDIGRYKQANNIPVYQVERWRHVINNRLQEGKNQGVEEGFLLKLLQLIHKASIQRQTQL